MKTIAKVVFVSLILLLAIPMASQARTITVKMDTLVYERQVKYYGGVPFSEDVPEWRGILPVFTNIQTSSGDTIIAIQTAKGIIAELKLRGDSTWLAPGTTILTNCEIKTFDHVLIGDPTGQDTRPVRIIASGLRTEDKVTGYSSRGTIDKYAGLSLFGNLKAYRLEVLGFKQDGGCGISVQYGSWTELYDYFSQNRYGLIMPGRYDAPAGIVKTVLRTFRCSFQDSLRSAYIDLPNGVFYYDEYSDFGQGVGVYQDDSTGSEAIFTGSKFNLALGERNQFWGDGIIISPSADFNDDGGVNFADFIAFVRVFGSQASGETAKFDLSKNGVVDFSDFLLLNKQFGKLTKPAVALTKPVAAASAEGIREAREFLDEHPGWMPLLPLELQTLLASAEQVSEFKLDQNFPNPFNPETTISYSLPEAAEVRLTIYGLTGQVVKTLVSARQVAGQYQIRWDGTDDFGRPVASGVYFYQLLSGARGDVRRMLLLK